MGHPLELPSLLKDAAQGQLRQLPAGTVQGLVNVKWKVRTWQNPENYSCLSIDFACSGRRLAQKEGMELKPHCTKPSKMLQRLKLELVAGAGTKGWLWLQLQSLQPPLAPYSRTG